MEIPGSYLIVPGLLKPEELVFIENVLRKVAFEDGAGTATDAARAVKKNLQMPKTGSLEKQQIDGVFYHALSNSPLIQAALMPTRILPPIISKYEPGMHYGAHVDSPLMGELLRTDIAITIFLNHPEEYDGGELELQSNAGTLLYKLPAGDAVCYPCTQLHRVKPVLKGERRVAVSWIQSMLRSSEHRIVLREIQEVISSLRKKEQTEEANLLQQTHSNLLRMWAE